MRVRIPPVVDFFGHLIKRNEYDTMPCLLYEMTKSARFYAVRILSCSLFYLNRQIRRQPAQLLHRIYSASPHSHDGATHGVTHGHRKYHHHLYVIPRPTTLPVLRFGIDRFAPAAPSFLPSRPLLPACPPIGSSHTDRIWCLILLSVAHCGPDETP